jgi:23S rRNA pseudouridine2604 synthase
MKKSPTTVSNEYPMRINKHMAHVGIATRRDADEMIARGKVLVNGKVATLGQKVEKTDAVTLRGHTEMKKLVYFAYHKPIGVITHSPQLGEDDIKMAIKGIPDAKDVFPIGRLDKDSSGLMILTNDGRLTERLLGPDYGHEKEYQVRTSDPVRDGFKKAVEPGVNIEGYMTKPCTVRKTGPKSFVITLTEGKKHQIRRMVAALHNTVVELKRTRILNVQLENLKPGALRPIEGEELATLLAKIGLN